MALQRYNTEIQVYQQNNKITGNCNAITFQNTGTTNCYIGEYLLLPNQSLSIPGNRDEMDITQYAISFTGGLGSCTVLKKVYV